MKRILTILVAICMMFSLIGCGQKAPETPTEPETPPTQTEEPLLTLPEGPLYLLSAEYNRLYCVNETGEHTLLRDEGCSAFSRNGDRVLVSFNNGEIWLFDLSNGTEELITACDHPANTLFLSDAGFYYAAFTMAESFEFVYNFASGERMDLSDYGWCDTIFGDLLAYVSWKDEQNVLTLFDISKMQLAAEIPVPSPSQIVAVDNALYFQADRWSGGEWYQVDLNTQSIAPAEIDLPTDYGQVLAHGDAGFLANDEYYASEHPGVWVWKDGNVTSASIPSGNDIWSSVSDKADGKVLLETTMFFTVNEESPDDALYYTTTQFTLYDTDTGTFTPVPFTSDTAKLFADGDFPVMDSSTARKPVTQSLYSLFCLQSEAGGAQPLCSTTHGAWLNIADRVADIALLAEPTAEEQAYLQEKGVEIETKLYGGDGLVFIGNDACGVTDLTLDQVRSIYRGEITNWAELGGVDAEIHVLYRDDQSGSQRLFEKLLWKGQDIPDFEALGFTILDEMSSIVSCCLYDPYAIGYSIMTYLHDVYSNEELLAFSLNGVDATPEQVAASQYPLGTQGYAVIRADEPENSPARRLYNWIGSPMCDQLLQNNGVTPLHG